MLTIGIDPGLTGAAALIGPKGLLEVIDLPVCPNGLANARVSNWINVHTLRQIVWDWSAKHQFALEHVQAVIERPIPMPSMPSTTIASIFDTFGSEIVAALMWGPKTWKEVSDQVGLQCGTTAQGWLRELRRAGVIYVHSYSKPTRGRAARKFAVQSKPFEIPDAREPF